MKTKLIAIILGTCVCTFLTNCTIEKRVFQKGYHIEWKKKVSEKEAEETADRITKSQQQAGLVAETPFESNVTPETEKPLPEPVTEPELPESMAEPITLSENPVSIHSMESENHEITSSVHQKSVKGAWETEERKVFELFGVMSFGLYFSSLTLAILGIVLLTSPYFFVAAGFMILLALIFGIISVDKYRRDKSAYRLNFFGYFGMIASLATITFVIGLLLLAWGLGSF
ncbi:hypothetical protein [uncultured Fluviicola sp.]|uniref:hypothetical protein n=1 Tax=uncultured Fluviicola sp. TaxID=463303 RepID=UPI0025E02B4E|nr:hypothetical protein [uncultured Fluviicola sp.]